MQGKSVYQLHDLNGNVVMEGTCEELAEKMCVIPHKFMEYASRGRRFKHNNLLPVRTNRRYPHTPKEKPIKKQTEPDRPLTDLELLVLVLYQRKEDYCSLNKSPVQYFPELLEKYGLDCCVHECVETYGVYKTRIRKSWTVEVKNRWTINPSPSI